jgi:hypothetical protein
MKIVQEFTFERWSSVTPMLMPDGWCPLSVREGASEYQVVMSALVDWSRPSESETFYMLNAGDSLPTQPDGKELAFIGDCQNGRYLFLQVDAAEGPSTRFVGRY